MYDYIITHSTTWPTLSVDWFPSPTDAHHEDYYFENTISCTYTNSKEKE